MPKSASGAGKGGQDREGWGKGMSDLKAALEAYMRLLARQGAPAQVIDERRRILEQMLPWLDGVERSAEGFRVPCERLLQACAPDEQVLALTCTREFYYFWLGDTKKVVEITARSGFSVRNVRVWLETDWEGLLTRMERDGFSRFPPSLGLYLGKLFEDGMSEPDIHLRERLLKSLLYLLDGQPIQGDSFRMMVDAVLLHLRDAELKNIFLQLVREYFYYWHQFPQAQARNAGQPAA